MFYDKNFLNNMLINLQKPRINNNNFFLTNYFFLTNNFVPFTNFFFFVNSNTALINLFTFSIKKNTFYFSKLITRYRRYFLLKKYLFKNKFKFNKFFKFNLKLIQNKKFTNFFLTNKIITFLPFFYRLNYKLFFKNWNFIIGSSISLFSWDLFSKKKWIRKNLTFNYIKNTYYFNKTNRTKKFAKTNQKFHNSLISKKLFINNYFYFKKININYNSFNFLIKNSFTYSHKNNYDWFFSKPYLFLNNYEAIKFNTKYPNYLIINLYKTYLKFFTHFKKFNFTFKLRNTNDILFKKFFFNLNLLKKSPNNSTHTVKRQLFNHFSFFLFKNFFTPVLNKRLKKKSLKKNMKFIWLLRSNPKTKVLKKNKFFSNLNVFSQEKINKKSKKPNFFFFNRNFFKLSRRLKKLHLLNNLRNFNRNYKSNKKINLIWIKKPCFFFNTNHNPLINLNYFKKNFTNILFKNTFFRFSNLTFKLTNLRYKNKTLRAFKSSNVFINFQKPFFFSKEKSYFICSKYGFLFTTDNFSSKIKLFYNLKKLIYSFSYKNEIQRFVLKRYVKSNFFTNFYNNNPANLSLSHNIGAYISSPANNDYSFSFFTSFFKRNNESLFLLNQNFFYSTKWTYFNTQLNFAKTNINDESNFIIKRVRFKPGYMSLWREVRNVLKTSLSLHFRYQYKLTNYLSKYNKFINFKTFLVAEMSLFNLLIRSRLLPDQSLCLLFIKNNLIYLNGLVCSNQNLQIFVGDFLQLIINLKYYILYKWFLNLSLKKKNRLRSISRKKMMFPSENDEKKRSNSLPKWVLFSKNSFDDVAKYLEVDYFTLSVMVLYEPFLWSDINPYNLIDQRFGIINLYNWKYIN